jgi:hypothetical protein
MCNERGNRHGEWMCPIAYSPTSESGVTVLYVRTGDKRIVLRIIGTISQRPLSLAGQLGASQPFLVTTVLLSAAGDVIRATALHFFASATAKPLCSRYDIHRYHEPN